MEDWRNLKLRLFGIQEESTVDGPGMRYAIFTQGCPYHCPGCHNPGSQPFEGGYERDLGSIYDEAMEDPLITGITFSGGEALCQAETVAVLAEKFKAAGKHLVLYTGNTYEKVVEESKARPAVGRLLNLIDLLVDGPFILAQRDLELLFRGSENQRLIDLEAMRKAGDTGTVILWEDNYV